ncbi:fatty acid desaturase [Salinisphaera aquimarina]|uniref:Fatty acid desaturase n=1 Tax=Salinisphaera aquimarina TaxID=2094031 RepID=A0ABV7ER63_9GAMM
MENDAPSAASTTPPRSWVRVLAGYHESRRARGVLEILITVIPFVLLWGLMWAALDAGYWAGLLLAVPAAGFLVRLFVIQHDCGHGSFFSSKRSNDWVGRVLGVVTFTAYDFWRRTHAIHHASAGNLDRPSIGDIETLTVREYRALPRSKRVRYRLYRHPLVLFGLGPAYLFLLRNRLPVDMMRSGRMPWLSTMGTNAAILLVSAALMWQLGFWPVLIVELSTTILAAAIGVWLFYVQHQFEDTYWDRGEHWRFHEAALHGSSHYDLPHVLRWFTANIGVHHVHHLCSRIPSYRLPEVLRDHPELREVGRLTLWQSLRCVRLVLWDEDERRLVSFREARALAASRARAAHPRAEPGLAVG